MYLSYEVTTVSYSIYKLGQKPFYSAICSDQDFMFCRAILWGNFRLIQKDLGDGIVMVGKLTFPAFYNHHSKSEICYPVSHRGFVRRFPGEPERVRKRVRYLWKALVSKNLYQLTVSCLDVRSINYSCCFLAKKQFVLSKQKP